MNICTALWSFVNFCCLSQSEVSTDNRKVSTFFAFHHVRCRCCYRSHLDRFLISAWRFVPNTEVVSGEHIRHFLPCIVCFFYMAHCFDVISQFPFNVHCLNNYGFQVHCSVAEWLFSQRPQTTRSKCVMSISADQLGSCGLRFFYLTENISQLICSH